MSEQTLRFPVFLKREDWEYLISGWEARARRIRARKSWDRYQSINRQVSVAVSEAYEEKEGDWKYVLYLSAEDYEYLRESARFVPKASRNTGAAQRVDSEFSGAWGDAREVEDE